MIGFVFSAWLHCMKPVATQPFILTMPCMYPSQVVSLFPTWWSAQLCIPLRWFLCSLHSGQLNYESNYQCYGLLYWVFCSHDQIRMCAVWIPTWVCFEWWSTKHFHDWQRISPHGFVYISFQYPHISSSDFMKWVLSTWLSWRSAIF